jgi:hypothetical protein
MTTKTKSLRQQSNITVRLIQSTGGNQFALVGRRSDGFMVHLSTASGSVPTYRTSFTHSLPLTTVKALFKKPVGSHGRIRNGWRWGTSSGVISIGCQTFKDFNYTVLRNWALGFYE